MLHLSSYLRGGISKGTVQRPMGDAENWRISAARFEEMGAAARQVRSERVGRARADVMAAIAKLQASGGGSLRQIAGGLNAAEIPTPRGYGEWSAVQV
jgi:hypothetical protein